MKRCALSWQVSLLCAAACPLFASLPVDAAQDHGQARDQAEAFGGDADHDKKPVTLKAVVVTAERRSQNIQDVPLTVTAMNQTELRRLGIQNVSDLNAVAPGLVVIPETAGYTTGAQFSLRGQFAGNPAMYWDSPTGIYVNGVYFGKSKVDVFDLPDLERIEVLNGPQGTLYGRNTLGGAINIITQKPSGTFNGTAELGYGRYNDRTGMVRMDLPALGKLKASVGARYENRDGWVKTTPGSSVRSLGKLNTRDAFVDLLFDATDDLSIEYRFDYNSAHNTPNFLQNVHSDVEDIFGIPGIITNLDRQTTASVDAPIFEDLHTDANQLHVTWKLPVGTLKYIGAHSETHYNNGLDLDGSPIPFAQSLEYNRYRETSNEFQYLGSAGRWNWVTGLYFFKDTGFNNNPQSYFFGAATFFPNQYGYGSKSKALYGQVDYKLTDQLTLTAGIRRTIDEKEVSRYMESGGFVLVPKGTEASKKFGSTTPMVSASYQFNPDHMVYARIAEGFLSGGFNAEAQTAAQVIHPYDPEKVRSYEIGTKNTFFEGRMRVNADVFHELVSDLQQIVFTAQGAAASNVLNVGKSQSTGLEAQVAWRATEDLELSANYSYMTARFDKFMQLGVNIAKNQSYAMLPRNILSLVGNYTFLHTSSGILHGTLNYRYTSGYYRYTYQKDVVNPSLAVAGNTWIRPNSILNGRIAFSEMNWGPVSGEVALWVNNITDRAHIDNYIDFGPSFGNLRDANFNLPRTYGVTVRATW